MRAPQAWAIFLRSVAGIRVQHRQSYFLPAVPAPEEFALPACADQKRVIAALMLRLSNTPGCRTSAWFRLAPTPAPRLEEQYRSHSRFVARTFRDRLRLARFWRCSENLPARITRRNCSRRHQRLACVSR